MKHNFDELLNYLDSNDGSIIEKITKIVDFIRPNNVEDIEDSLAAIEQITAYLKQNENIRTNISETLNLWIAESKISANIASLGILSKDGFKDETSRRFYNKFLPSAPKNGDFEYLFATIFYKNNDHIWVNAIEDEIWIALISTLLDNKELTLETKDYLFSELLYAVEILSIWIASEEFNENFIRLDDSLSRRDSSFIALQREVSNLVKNIQNSHIDLETIELDFQHLNVLMGQCRDLVNSLRKKSLNKGISVSVTYNLERLEQIINRIEDIIRLIKEFDTNKFYLSLMVLFKATIEKNSSRNSLYEIYNQNIKILAKSITNNASEHGDHYITENKKEYIKMLLSASGAGIVIAFMALIKINIVQLELPMFTQTVLASLNYGLGFVLIHILGFTVATKQPAMTASTFAKAVEKGENNKTDQLKLVELILQVNRSQFAAVLGNVAFALLVSFLIGYIYVSSTDAILSQKEVAYYMHASFPYPALFFAAIAGVWLFFSGLIAGYFDNRANYLDLKNRYIYHPLLKKITSDQRRKKIASYLHNNHGAILGNFYFGVLLGITPYLGYLLDIPLDIRHVAFSTANLGFCVAQQPLGYLDFFIALSFVLMIGFVNLSVSFILALKVSLKSRDAHFGSFFTFIKLLLKESIKRPSKLFFHQKGLMKKKSINKDFIKILSIRNIAIFMFLSFV